MEQQIPVSCGNLRKEILNVVQDIQDFTGNTSNWRWHLGGLFVDIKMSAARNCHRFFLNPFSQAQQQTSKKVSIATTDIIFNYSVTNLVFRAGLNLDQDKEKVSFY